MIDVLIYFTFIGATSVTDTTSKQFVEVSQPAASLSSTTTKPTMLAVFKQNYPKNNIGSIVQISEQSYQAQPVTLTILNSPSITTSTKGICLTNTSTYGNILMKPETENVTSDPMHSQPQSRNVLNTVVVSSTAPNSHGSIQYLVPALPSALYVPQSEIQIPASGKCRILKLQYLSSSYNVRGLSRK